MPTEKIHLQPFTDDGKVVEIILTFNDDGSLDVCKCWHEMETGERDWTTIYFAPEITPFLVEALQRLPQPKRKVIQIIQWGNCLAALCDDGSIWVRSATDGWYMIDGIDH